MLKDPRSGADGHAYAGASSGQEPGPRLVFAGAQNSVMIARGVSWVAQGICAAHRYPPPHSCAGCVVTDAVACIRAGLSYFLFCCAFGFLAVPDPYRFV